MNDHLSHRIRLQDQPARGGRRPRPEPDREPHDGRDHRRPLLAPRFPARVDGRHRDFGHRQPDGADVDRPRRSAGGGLGLRFPRDRGWRRRHAPRGRRLQRRHPAALGRSRLRRCARVRPGEPDRGRAGAPVRLQQRLCRLHPDRRLVRARPARGEPRIHQRAPDVPRHRHGEPERPVRDRDRAGRREPRQRRDGGARRHRSSRSARRASAGRRCSTARRTAASPPRRRCRSPALPPATRGSRRAPTRPAARCSAPSTTAPAA